MLPGPGRRARRLVRHEMLDLRLRRRAGLGARKPRISIRQAEPRRDPVAHLAPAGVVAARRIRVRHSDRVADLGRGGGRRGGRGVGGDADGRRVLQCGWVERVAEIGGGPGVRFAAAVPRCVEQQRWQEVVDYCGDYFGAYEGGADGEDA